MRPNCNIWLVRRKSDDNHQSVKYKSKVKKIERKIRKIKITQIYENN